MKSPTIYLGADHNGFRLKESLEKWLLARGYCVEDLSTKKAAGDDYPKIGFTVAKAVVKNPGSRGVLICGSGIGVAIAANRVKGIRAAAAHTPAEVKKARADEDLNILTLSGWTMSEKKAVTLLRPFLTAPCSRAARHKRRVKQLDT